jgi:antitoxin YefM
MITSTKHQAIVGKDGKLEILTSGFPEGTIVEVIVHETNHKELLEAVNRVESRQDLITFTPEEWNAQYNV